MQKIGSGQALQEALKTIKSRMENEDPLSPNSTDTQIDKCKSYGKRCTSN